MKNILFFCFAEIIGENDLSTQVAKRFGKELSKIDWINFADREILVRAHESVKGKDVVIIHSLYGNVNNSFVSLLMGLDAIKRSGSKSITLIFPYYFYSRQDRRSNYLDPIGSKIVSECIVNSAIDKLVLIELHSPHIMSFFDNSVYVEHLTTTKLIINELLEASMFSDSSKWAIVAPDYGDLQRAKEYADILKADLITMDKKRQSANTCSVEFISGKICDKNCLIIDDMLDTGGTIFSIARMLKEKGAKSVIVAITHALFSEDALLKLKDLYESSIIDRVFVTNSIPKDFSEYEFIKIIDLSPIIVESLTNN
ncbi:ribose-phosphate diphosphokinase [Candidatus Mycoplasma haematohominis]|uniref:ribose-phosphate diphosphokinase n=1 Tax=Candidatus Mycoplasma haematohominis TaxID=1494318 RepID=UPI001C0A6E12|nr:ribose-phosphate diphosphokinase [Candidatus Mycoplasma haemohominis]